MCRLLDPMAQDKEAEQEMLVVEEQEQFPPQMDPEPEMGAAAAYDTSFPPLHQNPPILAESAQLSMFDMGRLLAVLAGMDDRMENSMGKKMEGMNAKMDGMARTMREEMQCMGAGLQGGARTIKDREWGTVTGDELGE